MTRRQHEINLRTLPSEHALPTLATAASDADTGGAVSWITRDGVRIAAIVPVLVAQAGMLELGA